MSWITLPCGCRVRLRAAADLFDDRAGEVMEYQPVCLPGRNLDTFVDRQTEAVRRAEERDDWRNVETADRLLLEYQQQFAAHFALPAEAESEAVHAAA